MIDKVTQCDATETDYSDARGKWRVVLVQVDPDLIAATVYKLIHFERGNAETGPMPSFIWELVSDSIMKAVFHDGLSLSTRAQSEAFIQGLIEEALYETV